MLPGKREHSVRQRGHTELAHRADRHAAIGRSGGMSTTLTCGISSRRIIRFALKFVRSATPFLNVCCPSSAAFKPCTTPSLICAATLAGFTTRQLSRATDTRVTLNDFAFPKTLTTVATMLLNAVPTAMRARR